MTVNVAIIANARAPGAEGSLIALFILKALA